MEGLYLAVVSILDFDGFKCISILIRFAICRCYACLPNFVVSPIGVDEIKFIKREDECFGGIWDKWIISVGPFFLLA